MRVKLEVSGSMSIENTLGSHFLYRDYHENIENLQNGKKTDINSLPSDLWEHRDTEA
jgi:hypothetical protein